MELKNAALLGIFLSFMIGPVFFMLIKTSLLKGAKVALVFNLGVVLGDVLFIVISYHGSRPALNRLKDNPILFVLGGIILMIYGLVTIKSRVKQQESLDNPSLQIPQKTNYLQWLVHGFFLNCINIGVLAFWLGLVVVVVPGLALDSCGVFLYFTTIICAYFGTDVLKILLAKQLRNQLTPKNIVRIKKTMGWLLFVFGLVMLMKGLVPKEHLDLNLLLSH